MVKSNIKNGLLALLAATSLLGTASAQIGVNYVGLIDIEVPTGAIPTAITKDADGDIYVAIFASPQSQVIKIVDPESEIDSSGNFPTSPSGTVFASAGTFAGSRGFQGVAVASNGNVFAAGDNGGGSPQGIIRKWDASGNPNATFNSAADAANIRAGGLTLLSDDRVAIAGFNGFTLRDTTNFAAIGSDASGAPGFTRQITYNSDDNLIYPTRSGSSSPVKVAGYFGGGTSAAGGYTWTEQTLIPDGAIDTAFGTASSHGKYDPDRGWFLDAANGLDPQALRIYNVTNNGTTFNLLATVDGSTTDAGGNGQPFPLTDVREAIIIGDFLYVATSNSSSSIVVFEISELDESGAENWELYSR